MDIAPPIHYKFTHKKFLYLRRSLNVPLTFKIAKKNYILMDNTG